ncbi:camp-dependent protein kinase catalytic subunit [Quaeritorhiza haematococci]|nr:camp-dependent protein kinase catalytic subunit [Quaeritorhiza haematococci]
MPSGLVGPFETTSSKSHQNVPIYEDSMSQEALDTVCDLASETSLTASSLSSIPVSSLGSMYMDTLGTLHGSCTGSQSSMYASSAGGSSCGLASATGSTGSLGSLGGHVHAHSHHNIASSAGKLGGSHHGSMQLVNPTSASIGALAGGSGSASAAGGSSGSGGVAGGSMGTTMTSLGPRHARSLPKITSYFYGRKGSGKSRSNSATPLTPINTNLVGSESLSQLAGYPHSALLPDTGSGGHNVGPIGGSMMNLSNIGTTNTGASGSNGLLSPAFSVGTTLTQATRNTCLSAYEMYQPPPQLRSYHLDDFHIVRRVGKGGFASVYLVRLRVSTGKYWALKAIKKADVVRLKQEKQILNEKNILKSIKHPFIVELFSTFQDVCHLYMVMEYVAGGDLFSFLRKVQRFSEDDARIYVAETLIALEYLHSEDVIYRDLKPENILLDTTGHIKLADFGFAKIVHNTTSSFCGTPDYIAPEVVIGRPYTKSVDWWSLGVLIFELVSGKTPFGDDTSEKIYQNIQAGRIKWNSYTKGTCKETIRRLLELDDEKRLGSHGDGAEIRAAGWFKGLNWKKVESRQVAPPHVPSCDAPEVIERERAQAGIKEDIMQQLKGNGHGGDGSSWISGGDPFFEMFKDF